MTGSRDPSGQRLGGRTGVGAPLTDRTYSDEDLIRIALALAAPALDTGDVPVGALVLGPSGEIVGEGCNAREATGDPTAHAEIVALRAAAVALDGWSLAGCTLAVTVEPCTMCAGAIGAARVDRVVFGCWEPKTGAAGSLWDVLRDRRLTHRVEVRGGVLEADCAALVRDFFAGRRD
jgi:tRNA(adenine34) deaminase